MKSPLTELVVHPHPVQLNTDQRQTRENTGIQHRKWIYRWIPERNFLTGSPTACALRILGWSVSIRMQEPIFSWIPVFPTIHKTNCLLSHSAKKFKLTLILEPPTWLGWPRPPPSGDHKRPFHQGRGGWTVMLYRKTGMDSWNPDLPRIINIYTIINSGVAPVLCIKLPLFFTIPVQVAGISRKNRL